MTLFEHPDFEQAILATADHFGELGLRPSIIEKDYFAPEGMSFARSDAGTRSESVPILVGN